MKRTYAGGVLLMLVGFGCGSVAGGAGDERVAAAAVKAGPGPTVTETVAAKPAATVTATTTAEPRATVTKPGPTVTVTETESADAYDLGSEESDEGSSAVYYENCAAARAAGAAPVHRGDPGYGNHLDRDNDGTGCDWG
ncbi:excalibur calcium-binding domain-containing protein [Streptomyces albidochromogenes]|uniref:Excalibur calcium-binding domain-containing protein n=1 Tax=Streptomyces albidochromogenes TaxID=329524 RepID=A0ABW6FEJ2_9ACTN